MDGFDDCQSRKNELITVDIFYYYNNRMLDNYVGILNH
jgi:hypothetical protein